VDGRSLVFSAAQDTSIAPYLWRLPLAGDALPERIELAGPEAVRPAFSESGDRLAFSRFKWDVDMWRLDGGRPPERFMSSTVWDYNPEFAPDGTKIVFSSNRSGAMEIWTCERDGSKPVQLTEGPGKHQGSPRWSPDGNRIAFDSQGADGHWTIHVVDATGGRPRRLTPSVFDAHMPALSRDGRWIYFAANRTGRYEIWRVSASGGESTRITGNGGTVPSESWDGKTLYYSKTGYRFDPPDAHLFAKPLSGGAERIVLDSVANGAFFVASNGIYSVSRQPAGGYSLQFFDTATGKTKVLSKIDVIPYWRLAASPDRKTILFGASQPVGADLMMIPNFR
jgi:Tol biopolymer transport system component